MSSKSTQSVDSPVAIADGDFNLGSDCPPIPRARTSKVAQDMYAGEMPPGYDKRNFEEPLASNPDKVDICKRCGTSKSEIISPSVISGKSTSVGTEKGCRKCGGPQKAPPSSYPRATMASLQSTLSQNASSEAKKIENRECCKKCGRRRRSGSVSPGGSSPDSQRTKQTNTGMPANSNSHRVQTSGIRVPVLDIEPPTAKTDRASTLPFSPDSMTSDTALIRQGNRTQDNTRRKPSRNDSISSMFRSISRRYKKRSISPKCDRLVQQMPQPSACAEGPIAQLDPSAAEGAKRPHTSFSFVRQSQEYQVFEMNSLSKSKASVRHDSWEKSDEVTQFLTEASARPRYDRSQSTMTHVRQAKSTSAVGNTLLAPTADERPGLTRFQSLRAGVNRAANGVQRSASQVNRATSLRRLESVKKVPQLWYRNDMAFEGAQGEYNTYVY